MENFYHNTLKESDSLGVPRIYLNSSKVVEVAKKYYNCDSIKGVELEDYGGDGTTGSHWEERILLGDIMNGVVYLEEQVISEFTSAVLDIINLIVVQGVYCNLEKIKDVNF